MNGQAYTRIYAYPQGNGGIIVRVDEESIASLPEPLLHLAMIGAGFREVEE